MFPIIEENLSILNSATKYPSIPTYHKFNGENGLLPEIDVNFDDEVFAFEKIDGTNSRIIKFPNTIIDWFIGSREELLYFSRDLLHIKTMGIVDVLKEIAPSLPFMSENSIVVYYLETYGGKIGKNAKQYSKNGNVGFRLFDIMTIPISLLDEMKEWSPEQISGWRESGNQEFFDLNELSIFMEKIPLEIAPQIKNIDPLPTNIKETYEWLKRTINETSVKLDDSGLGVPEGIVVRNSDRSKIAKIRFQDYKRYLRRNK